MYILGAPEVERLTRARARGIPSRENDTHSFLGAKIFILLMLLLFNILINIVISNATYSHGNANKLLSVAPQT